MIRKWTHDTDTPKPDGGVDYHTVKAWFQQCRDMAVAVEAQNRRFSTSGRLPKRPPKV